MNESNTVGDFDGYSSAWQSFLKFRRRALMSAIAFFPAVLAFLVFSNGSLASGIIFVGIFVFFVVSIYESESNAVVAKRQLQQPHSPQLE